MSSSNPEKPNSDHERRERQDWGIVLLILLVGFLCVIVAGQQAMSFAPRWTLDANVESNIDLNSEFLTSQPDGYFEPLDPAILTQPGWASVFLTPGAPIPVGTSVAASGPTSTSAAEPTATLLSVTNTLPVMYTSTTIPTNTLVWIPLPATNTPKPKDPPPADTPTNTPVPPPIVDLHLTMDDGITSYGPGDTVTYTLTITSSSTVDVAGATVTDFLSAQLTGTSWSCVTDLGAVCGPGGSGNLSDTFSIPATLGAFVRYTITGTVHSLAAGPLVNTASVSAAADINPGDNTVTDSNGGPNGGSGGEVEIGPGDSDWVAIGRNTSIVMVLSPAILADGNSDYDLVYYERLATTAPTAPATDPRVDMDVVEVQISTDGASWQTVFFWGDGSPDMNTNVGIPIDWCSAETDNCSISSGILYGSTGIAINVDAIVPPGSYPWIRIVSPNQPLDEDGAAEVNSIQVLP